MSAFGKFKSIVKFFLISFGLFCLMGLVAGYFYALNHFQLTNNQFIIKVVEKTKIDWPWLVDLLSPHSRFEDHVMDGQLRVQRPRIIYPLLTELSQQGIATLFLKRDALYKTQGILPGDPCGGGGIIGQVLCWLSKDNPTKSFNEIISQLKGYTLETPSATGAYGNGWELAVAYDLLRIHPGWTEIDIAVIESKIEKALKDTLLILDDPSPSLWHGRSTLAAMAWLCAAALDPGRSSLISRAQGHFLDALSALELSEAWPEGYNYWIQNRAFLISLAGTSYLNGLEGSKYAERIRLILNRTGYWHIYATRPDNRIEGLGDEGSRVDLKDETRRVIDLLAQATRDPILSSYSHYLQKLHGTESYYRDYRSFFKLINDPSVIGLQGKGLQVFKGLLPNAELFGKNYLNLAYIRSGWSEDDTFISFKAGNIFTHHGHYDAGHFTIFKGAPLAINSSVYKDFTGANRLNYSIRSIAKNTLLILRPNEQVKPNRFFSPNIADGGQRITMPTGSAIQSTSHWLENLNQGLYLKGGRLSQYDHQVDYTYINADLTDAYNTPQHDEGGSGGKVTKVVRKLLYLRDEDRLIVNDVVKTVRPEYVKKWLLHTVNRPNIANLRLLQGNSANGILESQANQVRIENGRGHLLIDRIYPIDGVIRLVGGPDYQYYVESDGDDTELNGENFSQGASDKPWFDVGNWRIEIQPRLLQQEDEFIVALSPSLNQPRLSQVNSMTVLTSNAKGVITDQSMVVFINRGVEKEARFMIPVRTKVSKLFVVGLSELEKVELRIGNQHFTETVNINGMLQINLTVLQKASEAKLSWF